LFCQKFIAKSDGTDKVRTKNIVTSFSDTVCPILLHCFNIKQCVDFHHVDDFRGGLAITITGRNFDSIYGYSGNPYQPVQYQIHPEWWWPYISIWVGHTFTGGPEFFDWVRSDSVFELIKL